MRYGLIALALVGGVYAGLYFSKAPWKEYSANRAKASTNRAQMLQLEGKKADFLKSTARLETPLGMEIEARKAGFHKKDEVRLNGF
ncbi:MAG: hypothetical protein ABUL72_05220 [Armatimonadota bacterium]